MIDKIKAEVYTEDIMAHYRKMLRVVEGNFGKPTAEEFKKLVINKFKNL